LGGERFVIRNTIFHTSTFDDPMCLRYNCDVQIQTISTREVCMLIIHALRTVDWRLLCCLFLRFTSCSGDSRRVELLSLKYPPWTANSSDLSITIYLTTPRYETIPYAIVGSSRRATRLVLRATRHVCYASPSLDVQTHDANGIQAPLLSSTFAAHNRECEQSSRGLGEQGFDATGHYHLNQDFAGRC